MRGDRGDVDDAAFLAFDHARTEHLAREERAAHDVQVEVGVPRVERNVLELLVARHGDFRVVATSGVDEHADRTEGLFDLGASRFEAFLLARIGGDEDGLTALFLDRIDPGTAAFGIAAQHNDLGSGLCQTLGNRTTQHTGRSDNRSNFAIQIQQTHGTERGKKHCPTGGKNVGSVNSGCDFRWVVKKVGIN